MNSTKFHETQFLLKKNFVKSWLNLVSFISNVYKQRLFQQVEFSEKNKQRASWIDKVIKQQHWAH